jgi:hypothetical protein
MEAAELAALVEVVVASVAAARIEAQHIVCAVGIDELRIGEQAVGVRVCRGAPRCERRPRHTIPRPDTTRAEDRVEEDFRDRT